MKGEKKNINSLIGRKVKWNDIEFTIIDCHDTSDFVLIDDEYFSIIGLHWNNVTLIL